MLAEARIDVAGHSVAVDVALGEAVWLRGGNGSGKTSLLRALAGLAPGGRLHGRATHTLAANHVARDVEFVPEEAGDAMVGLTVGGERRLRGLPVGEDAREISALSTGEMRSLAISLVAGPLWLLDEPAAGLDAAGLAELRRRIDARGDAAVVFVDQTGRLADLADRSVDLGGAPAEPPLMSPPLGEVVASRASDEAHGLHLPALEIRVGVQGLNGPNGSGKSTLLRRAAGLEGEPVVIGGRRAVVGSDVRLLLPDARDHLGADSVAAELRGCDNDIAAKLVQAHLRGRHPLTLSRGEAQRVALAKVLGRPAAVYLLDEPDGHLDGAGRAALYEVLRLRADAAILIAGPETPWPEAARCGPS